jgi:hypothetical protein
LSDSWNFFGVMVATEDSHICILVTVHLVLCNICAYCSLYSSRDLHVTHYDIYVYIFAKHS